MPVKLNSSGGGSVTMDVGSTASNFTQNLPLATTTLVGTDTTQTLTNKTLSGATWTSPAGSTITSGTAVNSTSGTSIDFTSIPSWVKRVTVMMSGVSTNGSSLVQVQLGDSGGVETTGYSGYYFGTLSYRGNYSSGAIISAYQLANSNLYGQVVISQLSGNMWSFASTIADPINFQFGTGSGGTKTLSATLDRIRITTVGGTEAFNGGSINILYE